MIGISEISKLHGFSIFVFHVGAKPRLESDNVLLKEKRAPWCQNFFFVKKQFSIDALKTEKRLRRMSYRRSSRRTGSISDDGGATDGCGREVVVGDVAAVSPPGPILG